MARPLLTRLPLFVMALVVGGLALVVELLGVAAGLGLWSLTLLVIPAGLAAAYLLEYRRLPEEVPGAGPGGGASGSADPTEEEFVDPVEEADRLDSAAGAAPSTPDGPGRPEDAPTAGPP